MTQVFDAPWRQREPTMKRPKPKFGPFLNAGAGNESRPRDLNLGKVALYQLSYSRILQTGVTGSKKKIIAAQKKTCNSHNKNLQRNRKIVYPNSIIRIDIILGYNFFTRTNT